MSVNPIYSYCELENRYDAVWQDWLQDAEQEMEDRSVAIQQCNATSMEEHLKEVEWTQSRSRWSAAAMISQYFCCAATGVMGAAMVSTAPIAGGLFIGSSLIGLASRFFQDTGLFHAMGVSQERVQQIDMSATLLSGALSLAGGIAAHQLNAWIARGAWALVEKTMAVATGVIGAGLQVGKAYAEWHLSQLQSSEKHRSSYAENLQRQNKHQAEQLREALENRELEYQSLQRAAQMA